MLSGWKTLADLPKVWSSSLLSFLTSVPAFLYVPVCFDALETRFTRRSSPSPIRCLHSAAPLIGKVLRKND